MRLIDADKLLEDAIGMEDGWLTPPLGVRRVSDLIKLAPTVPIAVNNKPLFPTVRVVKYPHGVDKRIFECKRCGNIIKSDNWHRKRDNFCSKCGTAILWEVKDAR